jgi:hypothetical protein
MQWLKPVIPVIWEFEIGKIIVQGQPKENICNAPSQQIAELSGKYLTSQIHRKVFSGGSHFEFSLSKEFCEIAY